jgi:hypothetical protein
LVELLLCPSLLIQKLSERLERRRPGPPAQLAAAEWRVPPWFRLAEVWPVWPLQDSLWESSLPARLAFPSPPVPGLVRALLAPPAGPRLALVSPVQFPPGLAWLVWPLRALLVPLPVGSRLAPQRPERRQQQEQPPGLPELLPPERLAESPFLREPSWLYWLRICRVVPPRRRKE